MPRNCGCSGATCGCLIVSTDGSIIVTGAGSQANPYDLSAGNVSLAGRFQVQDSDTIDLTLDGEGTTGEPFILSAEAVLALGQLTDVDTTDTTVGYVVARGPGGGFVMNPPSTAPVGAINVGTGLSGDGSGGDPLVVTDYDSIAWLDGGAAGLPNLASLTLGDPTNPLLTELNIARATSVGAPYAESLFRMWMYELGVAGQRPHFQFDRDGATVGAFRLSEFGGLQVSADGLDFHNMPLQFDSILVNVPAATDVNFVDVAFNWTEPFSATPAAVANLNTITNTMAVQVRLITTTGASVRVYRPAGGTFGASTVRVLAFQMP